MTAAPVPDLVSIDVTGSAAGVLLTVAGEVDSYASWLPEPPLPW